jgi:hypothetical protein
VFGRWGQLVAAAGDPPTRPRPRWTRERALAALQELADELGRAPRSTDLACYPGMPSVGTFRKLFGALAAALRRRFGSWQAVLSAAGIEPVPPRRWPSERIVEALRSWEQAHGRPPRASEWRAGDSDGERPSSQVVVRRFGSWALALEAAGLSSQPHQWTPELIIGALRNWKRTHGRAPTVGEWNAMPAAIRTLRAAPWSTASEAGGTRSTWLEWLFAEPLSAPSGRRERRPGEERSPTSR